MKSNSDEITITRDSIIQRSGDVVSREIMGELIIVPLVSGIGDMEDEIYTLNETGRAIWERLDGQQNIGDIATSLAGEYDAPDGEIERDVQGIVTELLRRRMVIAT
ncbi:MAG: PqqD family protein [Methanomicrobiales archaeon]|nr:PqqD family protein [Methanomicrobiales archaeon]